MFPLTRSILVLYLSLGSLLPRQPVVGHASSPNGAKLDDANNPLDVEPIETQAPATVTGGDNPAVPANRQLPVEEARGAEPAGTTTTTTAANSHNNHAKSRPSQAPNSSSSPASSTTTTTTTAAPLTTTTTATTTTTTTTTTTPQPTTRGPEKSNEPVEAPECDNLCMNGGRCVVLESGQMVCICPEGFYGIRCQLKNICKIIIADNLNGDQVCDRIGRKCLLDDKLFRCGCDTDEFFVFKADYQHAQSQLASSLAAGATSPLSAGVDQARQPGNNNNNNRAQAYQQTSTFAYDSLLPLQITPTTTTTATSSSLNGNGNTFGEQKLLKSNSNKQYHPDGRQRQTYLAECRKIDKCLGVRCRQTSEVCLEGRCVCNQNLGYIQDPSDKLCKLIDPCQMATRDGLPICGQAKCVATYDRELYKCVCPIGYNPIKVGEHRSSIQCALLTNLLCEIPLLNNCQHVCSIDRLANTYKCSCLPGYKPGTRLGIDDNLCFFDEHVGESPANDQQDDYGRLRILDQLKTDDYRDAQGAVVGPSAPRSSDAAGPSSTTTHEGLITYDPGPQRKEFSSDKFRYKFTPMNQQTSDDGESPNSAGDGKKQMPKWHRAITIRRELMTDKNDKSKAPRPTTGRHAAKKSYQVDTDDDGADDDYNYDPYGELSSMSAQDRCNMYCEENKICVLEEGSRDSYRCVCDRQGYVSVGDKCLDWCSASEFSHGVQSLLAEVCYSGICQQTSQRPPPPAVLANSYSFKKLGKLERERQLASARSSWRPAFECDCTSSPLMFKDPETKLCKLDFDAIIRPCLPGNEGYTDCVVNKHSYCTVLHRHTQLFFRDLFSEQIFENQLKTPGGPSSSSSMGNSSSSEQQQKSGPNKKLRLKEKLYTCVCSPEKKFLVDKPRNKARCIDECDLLNNECGRFNRMCRAATIESNQDFGFNWNLIRFDRDGVRMNQFKRTGCECLPGFNVGPTEARDFTLDDNYPETTGQLGAASASAATVWPSPEALALSEQSAQRWQVMDAYEIFQDPSNINDINSLLSAEFSGPEFEHLRTKYININSRCLLDYDVVEFHASFKAPADFEPAWVTVKNTQPLELSTETSGGGGGGATVSSTEAPTRLDQEEANGADGMVDSTSNKQNGTTQSTPDGREANKANRLNMLKMPAFMRADISEFHKHVVLVAQCDYSLAQLSFEAYQKCLRYRYWVVQKLRRHFADWRRVMSKQLKETFDLMDGNIRFRVNKCEATIKRISTIRQAFFESLESTSEWADLLKARDSAANLAATGEQESVKLPEETLATEFDPLDHYARVDADVDCELTIHSASDDSGSRRHARKVLLEKQLPKFIFKLAREGSPMRLLDDSQSRDSSQQPVQQQQQQQPRQQPPLTIARDEGDPNYYLLAPNTLIQRESFDQLARHRKLFSPCKSDYAYCDKQTRCEMVDTVNYSCTCEYGYTPIGSRDIHFGDSRKEVCEDINECLFDVCKENGLENKSVCVNEIGDYKCQCTRHHVGDNKRYCNHICNVIACKYGDCRIPDEHHAFCECHEGYREADCSVLDPSVALRKANMIICGSIFTSVLLLAITLAISLNSQLKKTKKKLKRLEAAQDAAEFLEFNLQQAPFSRQRVSKASIGS